MRISTDGETGMMSQMGTGLGGLGGGGMADMLKMMGIGGGASTR